MCVAREDIVEVLPEVSEGGGKGEMLMTEDNAMLRTLSPRSRPPSRTAKSRVAGGRLHIVSGSFRCRSEASSSASSAGRIASQDHWRWARKRQLMCGRSCRVNDGNSGCHLFGGRPY